MPIVRGASMMSLGTWKARSTKYQRFLNLSNVFMLIVSTVLLFTSGILIGFYHLTKVRLQQAILCFTSNYYPSLTSGLGISMLARCVCWPQDCTHSQCLFMGSSFLTRNQGQSIEYSILKFANIFQHFQRPPLLGCYLLQHCLPCPVILHLHCI